MWTPWKVQTFKKPAFHHTVQASHRHTEAHLPPSQTIQHSAGGATHPESHPPPFVVLEGKEICPLPCSQADCRQGEACLLLCHTTGAKKVTQRPASSLAHSQPQPQREQLQWASMWWTDRRGETEQFKQSEKDETGDKRVKRNSLR